MKKFIFVGFLLLTGTSTQCVTFAECWMEMRREYKRLIAEFCEEPTFNRQAFYHPFWEKTTDSIKRFILGPPRAGLLQHPALTSTMVRGSSGGSLNAGQYHELCYLKYCVSPETDCLVRKFKEPAFGDLAITCAEYGCSTNSLGQLYYAARILEKMKSSEKIRTIVEVGGGFGNLAYIFKSMLPDATLVLFDLPELLVIQYLYLTLALPDVRVTIHHDISEPMHTAGIHLIPIFLLPEADVKADVFVSNFALSEATTEVQQAVINKNFFDAPLSYITGQLNGAREEFVNQKLIHEAVRTAYDRIDCLPFHLFYPGECEPYELIGTR